MGKLAREHLSGGQATADALTDLKAGGISAADDVPHGQTCDSPGRS